MGRYEAVRLLGEGGMGKVYLAHQLDLNRQVVIKVMHEHVAADPIFRERFQRETMLMARFQHPNAVTLYDASLTDGPCIVMEYVKGLNLDLLLQKNNRFSPGRVGRIIGQLCEVLQAAHDNGMIHRDLKPSNLMIVDFDSPRERLKVMDFGLAKLTYSASLEEIKENNLSGSNFEFALGTPGYICPEQVRGDSVDHRGDLYSVGVIMYELLTGRLPFSSASIMDMMIAHATDVPPSFKDIGLGRQIPSIIEDVVMRCLEKDPNRRPQCARDLAEEYETAVAIVESGMESKLENQPPPGMQKPVDPLAFVQDPTTIAYVMEAWMPESIALIKLRGYASDNYGNVLESVPGHIRLEINPGAPPRSSWSSLFGRKPEHLNVELNLRNADTGRANNLFIQVVFRPNHISQLQDPVWRSRCSSAFVELRSYLMGK